MQLVQVSHGISKNVRHSSGKRSTTGHNSRIWKSFLYTRSHEKGNYSMPMKMTQFLIDSNFYLPLLDDERKFFILYDTSSICLKCNQKKMEEGPNPKNHTPYASMVWYNFFLVSFCYETLGVCCFHLQR